MENNISQKIDKKLIIKNILIPLIWIIAFTLPIIFIQYGGIPVKVTLISYGILVVMLTTGMMLRLKYPPNRISVVIIRKFFLVFGILMIIVNLALLLMEGSNIIYYIDVGVGLCLIYYSRTYKGGGNSLFKNNTI